MKTLEEKIAVMQAALEGKRIESHNYYAEETWIKVDEPQWNWGIMDYRVKPEEPKPEYVPYESAEEFLQAQKEHGPMINTSGDFYYIPLFVCNTYITNQDNDIEYGSLIGYTWQDGTPCGKLKQ